MQSKIPVLNKKIPGERELQPGEEAGTGTGREETTAKARRERAR